ncbi:sensor histidine kinase [Sphingomonas aracearum]|uniref:histidine kinase n=1 Tax=Sphingomonas aracearum TaxID=2283317 RepID=A0A369VWV8_9SPHN|nr:sensor histidine kinase [Sphingomonas aracearum]
MRLSVTARIALLAIALALISNVVLVGFVWRQVRGVAVEALRRDTMEQADTYLGIYRTGGRRGLDAALRQADDPADPFQIAALVDADGRRIVGAGPQRMRLATGSPSFTIGGIADAAPWSQHEAGYTVRRVGQVRLVSGHLLNDWAQEQRGIERALLLAVLLSLALGVGGGLVVARYVGNRLGRIVRVIDGVGQGDLSARVGHLVQGGGDAFDRLAHRLDAMLDKIERLMGEVRVVSDSLAHDLRSPLARLRSKAEAAALAEDAGAREAALSGLLAETDLVLRMLSTLLEISRSESVGSDRFSPTPLAELVEEIGELYAPVVEDAGLAFTVSIESRPAARPLHRELLTQAVTNLIDNALRHGVSGGEITLRLSDAQGRPAIAVEDRGPGIAKADRAQALRRFGRLDGARTLPGAGLGLALVEAVTRLHGGAFELADNAPGLVARILLPARPVAEPIA